MDSEGQGYQDYGDGDDYDDGFDVDDGNDYDDGGGDDDQYDHEDDYGYDDGDYWSDGGGDDQGHLDAEDYNFQELSDDDYLNQYQIQDDQQVYHEDEGEQQMHQFGIDDGDQYQNGPQDLQFNTYIAAAIKQTFSKMLKLPQVPLNPNPNSNLNPYLSSPFNPQLNPLFQFDKYNLDPNKMITFQQEARINYEIDQMKLTRVGFGMVLTEKQMGQGMMGMGMGDGMRFVQDKGKDVLSNGIFRFRREEKGGGVIQILGSFYDINIYKQKEMKIEIKVVNVRKAIFCEKQRLLCLQFQGAPAFFLNERNENLSNLQRQKKYKVKSKQNFLSAFLLDQDSQNGTFNLKHSPKKWQRIKNIAQSKYQEQDLIMKYLGFRHRVLILKVASLVEEGELVNVIGKFGRIGIQRVRFGMRSWDIGEVYSGFSDRRILGKFQKLGVKDFFGVFQIQFSVFSMLFECDFVDLRQVEQLSDYIVTLIKKNQNEQHQKQTLKKILQTLITLTREQLYTKISKGKNLLQIFKTKLSKKSKKNLNFVDNIQIKALKATPSGLLPAGWTRDLRNRMVRHFCKNDFQFMKIQVTDDDDQRSKLFNGGDVMRKHLYQLLTNLRILGVRYQPIGWTQSQLKTSSLWYTCQPDIAPNIIPRKQLVDFLGKFDHIKNAALKAARIGQNLSTGKSIDLKQVHIEYGNDDRIGKYLYTDGIGKISPDLVKKIRKQLDIPATALQIRYLGCKGILLINHKLPPNTIYFRESMKKFDCPHSEAGKYFDILDYNYYKPGYLNRQILILLSANKIPNKNLLQMQRQYIKKILEQGLNFQQIIQNDKGDFDLANNFKQKYYKQFDPISQKLDNIADILTQLSKQKQLQIMSEPTLNGILIEKYYLMFERLVKKSHIRVEKSARILGVIDDYGILNEGEIYCTIVREEGGLSRKGMKKKMKMLYQRMRNFQQKDQMDAVKNLAAELAQLNHHGKKIIKMSNLSTHDKNLLKKYTQLKKSITKLNITGKVMLTRNPCMHPADVRVVTCISKQQAQKRFKLLHKSPNFFQEIPNCIIFPKSGKYPLTAQISGSDLDGDTFFICWDQRLMIPQQSLPPFITDDQVKIQRNWAGNGFNDMIEFFCEFVFNNNLGRLANSHLVHADKADNAFYYKCVQLCKIHNKAVDYPKKGYVFDFPKQLWVKQYPHFMQKGKQKKTYRSSTILGELYDESFSYYAQFTKRTQSQTYNLAPIKKCMSIKFTQPQYKQACATVLEYNKQIQDLLSLYKMKREFEIYAMKISFKAKESRARMTYIDEIKLKYFGKFFKEFGIDGFKFLGELKKETGVIQEGVLRKIALWYLVSHVEMFEIDYGNQDQRRWIMEVRKCLGKEKIKYIGLCWFCLPFLTCQMLKYLKSAHRHTK